MTCGYTSFFSVVWGSAVLAIPTIIGLFVWLVITLVNEEFDEVLRIVLLSVGIALLIAWTVGLRAHGPRVLIRSGAFPAWCRGDHFPREEVELRQAVVDIRERTGSNPVIVGGGWGFFLKRHGPPGPRIFTHNFTGQIPTQPGRWRAGTTIAEVTKHYGKQGRTLSAFPTMNYISIGSWVSHCSHGNSGNMNPQPHDSFASITLLDMSSGSTKQVDYKDARRLFDSSANRYVVLDVSFRLVQNDNLEKRGILVKDAQSAADWLAPGAALRLCFLGAARDYAVGLRWEKPYSDTDHRDPHFCSVFCTFLQVDVFSVFGGCIEEMQAFNGISTRQHANTWVPPIFPVFNLGLLCSGLLNFEIFFKLPDVLDGNTLYKFIKSSIAMHQKRGGRSEVRYGNPSVDSVIHWDISLTRPHFSAAFQLLADTLGVVECAIHSGKHGITDTAPLKRISCYEIYYWSEQNIP
jgi:hypothetical protein